MRPRGGRFEDAVQEMSSENFRTKFLVFIFFSNKKRAVKVTTNLGTRFVIKKGK